MENKHVNIVCEKCKGQNVEVVKSLSNPPIETVKCKDCGFTTDKKESFSEVKIELLNNMK